MSLGFLAIRNLRCIQKAELELDVRSNLVIGPNAAGKTTVLEALCLLSYGRSFRTTQLLPLVRADAEEFIVSGRTNLSGAEVTLGLQGGRNRREARLNGEAASLAELALRFPVQVLEPEVHKLIEEGPSLRRRFVDWGVFHVEPTFREAWKRYARAIQQRNTALKTRQSEKLVRIWDRDLIDSATVMTSCRERYVEALQQFVKEQETMLGYAVDLVYSRGWHSGLSFEAALTASWSADVMRGLTTAGPHRADLLIAAGGMPAKGRVSRGQQKMLAAALILAQQAHRASIGMPPACLLVDDPAAELDVDNLGKLLGALAKIPTQLVVTALNPTVLDGYFLPKVFHVKHGVLQ